MKNDLEITQDLVRSIFHYGLETGELWRKVRYHKNKPPAPAGRIHRNGYRYVNVYRRLFLAHRLVWLYVYGNFPSGHLDHINGNKSDNRIENLREVTVSQNLFNKPLNKQNKSGVKGVSWDKRSNRWIASLQSNYKIVYRKGFKKFEDAVDAIKEARERIHGEFANHG